MFMRIDNAQHAAIRNIIIYINVSLSEAQHKNGLGHVSISITYSMNG